MKLADSLSVAENLHTEDGLFWPVPVVNLVKDASGIEGASRIALRDPNTEGNPVMAIMDVSAIETVSDAQIKMMAEHIFATLDPEHPGVATFTGLGNLIWLNYIDSQSTLDTDIPILSFHEALSGAAVAREEFEFTRVDCDHPLWVLYSSGTTGLPKAIMHTHVGMITEQLKNLVFHMDLGPGKRIFFYSTTGWMMWNIVVSSLISGASAVLYDGSPTFGGIDKLWRMASEVKATIFGASPTLVHNMKAGGVKPNESFDLSSLDTVLVSGSPSTPETFEWFYENVASDIWVTSQSGGTDMCSGFFFRDGDSSRLCR